MVQSPEAQVFLKLDHMQKARQVPNEPVEGAGTAAEQSHEKKAAILEWHRKDLSKTQKSTVANSFRSSGKPPGHWTRAEQCKAVLWWHVRARDIAEIEAKKTAATLNHSEINKKLRRAKIQKSNQAADKLLAVEQALATANQEAADTHTQGNDGQAQCRRADIGRANDQNKGAGPQTF